MELASARFRTLDLAEKTGINRITYAPKNQRTVPARAAAQGLQDISFKNLEKRFCGDIRIQWDKYIPCSSMRYSLL